MLSRVGCYLLGFGFPTLALSAELRVATLNVGALIEFDPSFQVIYGIGPVGQSDHDAVAVVLARIDADVVALQEISSNEITTNLVTLANDLGYPYLHVSTTSRSLDNSLRVVFLSRYPFLESRSIESIAPARELTRNHPMVKIDVPGTEEDPWIIAAHLKSGTTHADRFRRAVEMQRLVQGVMTHAATENFVILGDFNPSSSNMVYNDFPSDLAVSFQLGADLGFPISYDTEPMNFFAHPRPIRLDARRLDGSPGTFPSSNNALDLIFISRSLAARPVFMEIYQSELDIDNLSGLTKHGSPLSDNTSALASDHLAVFADLQLSQKSAYAFHAPGQTVEENFNGLLGVVTPEPWENEHHADWIGVDHGAKHAAGFRTYGPASDPALGFLPSLTDGDIKARFVNHSSGPLTALEISYSAEQWRASMQGLSSRIEVDLILQGETIALPELTHTAANDISDGLLTEPISTRKSTRATGLHIPPGGSWELAFRFLQGDDMAPLPADVFINEFHYDNSGTDVGEFVEVVVGPGYTGDLANITLHPYNGDNGQTYNISSTSSHSLDTFQVHDSTPNAPRFFWKYLPNIQNGAPDGFALVVNGTTTDFISYEGSFSATNGPAAGMISVDVGFSQNGNDAVGEASIGLTGHGYHKGAFTWQKFTGQPHTPGQPNSGQDFSAQAQGLAVDDLSVTFLPDHDRDGIPDDEDPDDDNDGQSDEEEEIFGTDPLDASSRYEVTWTRIDETTLRLAFPTLPDRTYTVEWSEQLSGWEEMEPIHGTGEIIELDFPLEAGVDRRFFRLKVQRP